MKTARYLCVAIASLILASCDRSTDPGGAGTLNVSLVSPNGAEGAAILDVAGEVESVSSTGDTRVFSADSPAGKRVVIVRGTAGSLSVRLRVPDVSRPPQVTVVEVADGDDRVRVSLAGYHVELN